MSSIVYNRIMKEERKADQIIEETILELLATEPLDKINIRMLVKKCGLNRNTFYYYYNNIPDLLESITRKIIDDFLAENPPTFDSIEKCFLAAIKLAQDNKQIINNIYHSTSRSIFERHLWHLCDYSISSFMQSFEEKNPRLTATKFTAVKDFLKFECFGFTIDWLNRGMPDDVAEKAQALSSFVTHELTQLTQQIA